jgi:dihydroflavonol-4-reductase
MARRAFVTGGTGFVGLNLVQQLIAAGWDVTALRRPSSDISLLSRFNPRLVTGAITDAASMVAALPDGIDTVFHVAGNTNMWRKRNAEQTHDNVDGTRNVVEAAVAKGVRRLVVTSSISAYGPVKGVITEETPSLAKTSSVNYERSKYAAQEIARAAISRGLEVIILQPGAIIGPYDIGTWSQLFGLVKAGKLSAVPPAFMTFAHVHEVAAAHITAADVPVAGNGQYLLGGEDRMMLEFVQQIATLVGKKPPTGTAPLAVVKLAAYVGDFISNFTGKPPAITPEMASALAGATINPAKAQRDLGFKIVPLETMVRDCYDWMVAENRI